MLFFAAPSLSTLPAQAFCWAYILIGPARLCPMLASFRFYQSMKEPSAIHSGGSIVKARRQSNDNPSQTTNGDNRRRSSGSLFLSRLYSALRGNSWSQSMPATGLSRLDRAALHYGQFQFNVASAVENSQLRPCHIPGKPLLQNV